MNVEYKKTLLYVLANGVVLETLPADVASRRRTTDHSSTAACPAIRNNANNFISCAGLLGVECGAIIRGISPVETFVK